MTYELTNYSSETTNHLKIVVFTLPSYKTTYSNREFTFVDISYIDIIDLSGLKL